MNNKDITIKIWIAPDLVNYVAEGKNPKVWSLNEIPGAVEMTIPLDLYNSWTKSIITNGTKLSSKQILHD